MRIAALILVASCGARTELGLPQPTLDAGPAPASCLAPHGIETIASLGTSTGRILVDEQYVFADTNRGLFRVRKCGGPIERIATNAPGQYAATGMVQDEADVYLVATAPTRGGFVRRVMKDGSSSVDLFARPNDLFGLALRRSELAWISKEQTGQLWKMNLGTRAPLPGASIPIAYSYGPVVADELGLVFYAEEGNNHGSLYDARDGQPVMTRSVSQSPVEIALGLKPFDLYFTFGHTTDNGIAHVTRGKDATHRELVAHGRAPFGLARHERTLYWSDSSDGAVRACDLDPTDAIACSRQRDIASSENDPRFVFADDNAVYWATSGGTLKRAPP